MINVSDKVRELYKTDRIPIRKEPITKKLYIRILETGTVIRDADMELENFTLEESICSAGEIVFGSCEASFVSFAVYQTVEDLSSKTVRIWQTINGNEVPFGTYKVATVTKRDGDPRWKDITAYDRMPELDRDATAWFTDFWNRHPVSTIKEFRLSFFEFMGFDIVEQTLISDHVEIKKTIDPEFIKARYIAQKIGEINASFGHFTRENKFKYIDIGSLALYPAEDLYPSEDLFPAESTEILSGDSAMLYFADESHYEDYYVRAIDSVQIKASDGSAGITVGEENKNPYIIHSNFFTFGKSERELRNIAQSFLGVVKRKFYIPNTTSMIGLPYLEVGDSVTIILEQDAIESFIFQRRLTGIHALKDEITAKGNEYRKNDIDEGTELMQLKSKVENVVADTDQKIEDVVADTDQKLGDFSDEVDGKFAGVNTQIGGLHISLQQTNEGLAAEVTRAKGEEAKLSSTITMTANEIKLAVSETYQTKSDANSQYAHLESSIRLTAQDITSTVSATYETKSAASASYANLSSQIVQTADSITSTVSATYETKSNAGSYYQSFQSQINQTAHNISMEVSRAQGAESDLSSRINVTADQISLKVSRGDVQTIIEQNADSIRLKGGSIVIDSTYFSVTSNGYATLSGGEIGSFTLTNYGALKGNGIEISGSQLWCNNIVPYSGSYVSVGEGLQVDGNVRFTSMQNISGDNHLGVTQYGFVGVLGGSSKRWKHGIKSIQDAEIDPHRLYSVRTREFIYNEGYLAKGDCRIGKKIPGFVVEQLQEDYPIAVDFDKSGNPVNWSPRMFIAPMLQLIQEQHKQIGDMKEELMSVSGKVLMLSQEMEELKRAQTCK